MFWADNMSNIKTFSSINYKNLITTVTYWSDNMIDIKPLYFVNHMLLDCQAETFAWKTFKQAKINI
jgi:hypothetical protein